MMMLNSTSNTGSETPESPGQISYLDDNDSAHSINLIDLPGRYPDALAAVQENSLGRPARFLLSHHEKLTPEERWGVFRLIEEAGGVITSTVEDGSEGLDLVDFALSCLHDDSIPSRCKESVDAAIEAIALLYGDDPASACSKLARELKRLKVSGYTPAKLCKRVAKLAAAMTATVHEDAGPVANPGESIELALDDCPYPSQSIVPAGWVLSGNGICVPANDHRGRILVAAAAIIIVSLAREPNSEIEYVSLAWHRHGQWQSRLATREEISDARKLVSLSRFGLPVTSGNASQIVEYLAAFETVNFSTLPRIIYTKQQGWTKSVDGQVGFVLGADFIVLTPEQTDDQPSSGVIFQGRDDGDDQLVAGYRSQGELHEWKCAVSLIAEHPTALLVFYAAFAAPILEHLGVSNFIVDVCGPTSQGKTTLLRLAASVFGNPRESDADCIVMSWDATPVGLERAAATRTHLPLLIDDTKLARFKEDISRLIYDFAGGRGRQRGSVTGSAATSIFRGVAIITGEAPATSYSGDGGTHARVLPLWGSPFGPASQEIGVQLSRALQTVSENYGKAGRVFIKYLIDNDANWLHWKTEFNEHLRGFQELGDDNPIAQRMAPKCAAICLAAQLAHEALDLPWAYADPVTPLWDTLTAESSQGDRATSAMRSLHEWTVANHLKFCRDRSTPLRQGENAPPMSVIDALGLWPGARRTRPYKNAAVMWYGFLPDKLYKFLNDAGYEADAIIRTWQDRGWLLRDTSSRKFRLRGLMNGSNPWLIAIPQPVLEGTEEETRPCQAE